MPDERRPIPAPGDRADAEGRPFAFVRESFRRNGFGSLVGASITVPAAGRAEVRIPFRKDLAQQHGFFHGALSGAAADMACGYAALSLMPDGSSVLAVEYTIHFLEPALGQELIARADVVRAGKRLFTCRCDIFVVRDGKEFLSSTVLETVNGRRPES
jgi:uncharacterized protein (TIGR00369 family)